MNTKQQRTLEQVFEKPDRSDIYWDDIESLFQALGAEVSEGKGSRIRVVLNDVKAIFHRPHPQKVANKSTVRSVRRFLFEAGGKQ